MASTQCSLFFERNGLLIFRRLLLLLRARRIIVCFRDLGWELALVFKTGCEIYPFTSYVINQNYSMMN